MENIDKFRNIIHEIFDDYFKINSFNEFNDQNWIVSFKNEYCIFRFTNEYSDISLNVTSINNENTECDLKIVYIIIMGKSFNFNIQLTNGEADRFRRQLLEYLNFLTNNLSQLPFGDFSWKEKYIAYLENEKLIHSKLWSLNISDPIYQKFKSGDLSWHEEIQKLIDK